MDGTHVRCTTVLFKPFRSHSALKPPVCNATCSGASFLYHGHTRILHHRYQVGRALRAVDYRLKREWINWAENGLCCKGIQHATHRQRCDFFSTGEPTNSALVGLARKADRKQGHGAASMGRPSAEARGLLQRRGRCLRAWCSKVRAEAREGKSVAMFRNTPFFGTF